MRDVRFLFFDLDGTLLNDRKELSGALVNYLRMLKRRTGVGLGFSTGRHGVSVEPYLRQYGLRELLDGMVCNSGSDLYDFSAGEHVKNHYLDGDRLRRILDTFRDYDFLTVAFHDGERLVATRYNRAVESILRRNAYQTFYYPEQTEVEAAPKCLLLFEPEDRERAERACLAHPMEGIRWVVAEPYICEMLDRRNSKAAGAAALLERYGLSLEDVMVFGDEENDRQIMRAAGISVCMKNGSREMQAIAGYVTDKTNNEDGVLDFLRKHEALFSE